MSASGSVSTALAPSPSASEDSADGTVANDDVEKVKSSSKLAGVAEEKPVESDFQDICWINLVAAHPEMKLENSRQSLRRGTCRVDSFQAYVDKHSEHFNKVLELEKPDGWTLKQEEDGVQTYLKAMPGCRFVYFKGYTEMDCDLATFLKTLLKTEDRVKWDEMCEVAATPEQHLPYYKYSYVRITPPIKLVAPRDLCIMCRFRFLSADSVVVAMESAPHGQCPESSGCVRSEFLEGGYVIRTLGPNKLGVTWTGCVDPKGLIPAFVVNLAVAKQTKTLAMIQKFMKKEEAKAKSK